MGKPVSSTSHDSERDSTERVRAAADDDERSSASPVTETAAIPTPGPGGAPPPAPGPPPRQVGRYLLQGELGRGGKGVVYRAFDPDLRRYVALKMILDVHDPDELRRFRSEASANARLTHPAIVPVHEIGEHDGRPFIVMGLVEGESFESALRRAPFPPKRTAEVVRTVALALQHAHESGIVHRDVKPENVLIDAEGRAFLSDFGLARHVAATAKITVTGTVLGTPAYMPPEQARGDVARHGPRSDVYGLGAVLYRAIVGRPPFAAETIQSAIIKVIQEDPEPPRRANPAVHEDLETIALRCLAKDPERRYASAAAVAEDLRRYIEGEPILARPITRLERARIWASRNRPVVGSAAALAATLAIAGLLLARAQGRAEADRRAAIERARAESARAWDDFTRARAANDHVVLVERALDAHGAAHRFAAAAPEDPAARDAAFDAALALADVALAAEQWSLASIALRDADKARPGDPRVATAQKTLESARTRVETEHRRRVESILEQARSGAIASRPDGFEDALFTLVGLAEPQTVALLAAELDATSRDLSAVTREMLLAAGTLEEGERRAGLAPIDGLEPELDRWLRAPTLDPSDPSAKKPLEAMRRLQVRAVRVAPSEVSSTDAISAQRVLSMAQERRLGPRRLATARLACEALGRMGIEHGAVEPLARHLHAEWDGRRASHAAIALLRIVGDRAEPTLAIERRRFGSLYWDIVSRAIARLPASDRLEGETAEAYAKRAEARFVHDDVKGAIADSQRAVELDPRCAPAWGALGNARAKAFDLAGARAAYDEAIRLDPTLTLAFTGRALARSMLGDYEGALVDADKAIALEPARPFAWDVRGIVRSRHGDHDAAIADFTRAIAIDPTYAAGWSNRGTTRFRAGEHAAAIADLDRGIQLDPTNAEHLASRSAAHTELGHLGEAIADATRAIELDPGRSLGWNSRGNARSLLGDVDGAIADLTHAIELDPTLVAAWTNRAAARRNSGDLKGSIADCEEALRIDGASAAAHINRSMARRDLGDLDGAIADCTSAIAIQPRRSEAWGNRGVSRWEKHDYAGAVADLQRALELAPGWVEGWANLGGARASNGDLDGAIAACDRAIALDPKQVMAWNNRAIAKERKRDYEGAVEDYTRAIQLQPEQAKSWDNRGHAREADGELRGALADYAKAVELDPRRSRTWTNKAAVERSLGLFPDAVRDASRALELDPKDSVAWAVRGYSRLVGGDREGAIADLEKSLQLGPDDPEAVLVQRTLDGLKKLEAEKK